MEIAAFSGAHGVRAMTDDCCFVADEGLPLEDDYYTENAIDRLLHAAQK